jgi:hypothetical protein
MLQVGETRLNKFGRSVSEDFLKMFTFPLLQGDQNTALSDPSSIVITQSTAKAFFGDDDPIGKIIRVDNDREQKVTGVVADVPKNSAFRFDYLLPFSFYEATQPWVKRSINNWDNNSFQMYVQLRDGATEAETNEAIKDVIKDNNTKAPTAKLFLHPMSKWRLLVYSHRHFCSGYCLH